jgi:membrane fusion protein (multidrug efflux system)
MPPRTRKATRYFLLFALPLIVGALVFVKFSQISLLMAMGKEMEKAGPPPEAVGAAAARLQSWEGTLTAIGNVAGAKSVALSNDAPGRVTRIHFESGAIVKQGQILVELDTSVERAQLGSTHSRRNLALLTTKRSRALFAENVVARAQLDNDEAQLKTLKTDTLALQAQIERKIVRAPFSGRLGIRAVDLGQYLNAGTTLTVLEATGAVFVDFTLPQKQLESVGEGMPVRVTIEGASVPTAEGVISAVDPTVDNVTRSLKLRASIPNKDNKLRPGMFVNVSVVLPNRDSVVAVPATAVVHASFGDSVFVIEDKKPGSTGMTTSPSGKPVKIARQQFVRLGESRGDFVAIAEGVKAGQELVSAGAFKLRNGSPVVVDNSVKADAELKPRPENR